MDETLKHKVDLLVSLARKNIERDGHLFPALVLMLKNGGGWARPLDFSTPAKKDAYLKAAYDMVEVPEVLAVMVLCEAFYCDCEHAPECPLMLTPLCSKRGEAISATLVTRTEARGAIVPFTRKEGRVVTEEARWQENVTIGHLESRPSNN